MQISSTLFPCRKSEQKIPKLTRLKPRPNDRNMPTQHIPTLLGATCCVRLATVLGCVATCWVLLAQVWKWANLSQQQPTVAKCRNRVAKRTQHVAPNNVAICWVCMLRSFGRGLKWHSEKTPFKLTSVETRKIRQQWQFRLICDFDSWSKYSSKFSF